MSTTALSLQRRRFYHLLRTGVHRIYLTVLSMPKRGPKCKLGYYRVFNLILWLLYTGMQWKCLPIPQDSTGKPVIHYTTVYKVFTRNGLMMGHFGRRLWPVYGIWRQRSTSTPACFMAAGPTPWPKKMVLATQATSTRKGRKVIAMTDNNGYVLAPLPVAPVNETDMVLLPKGGTP